MGRKRSCAGRGQTGRPQTRSISANIVDDCGFNLQSQKLHSSSFIANADSFKILTS